MQWRFSPSHARNAIYCYYNSYVSIVLLIGEGYLGLATPTPGGDDPPKQPGRAAESRGGKVGPTASQFQAHHEHCTRALAKTVSSDDDNRRRRRRRRRRTPTTLYYWALGTSLLGVDAPSMLDGNRMDYCVEGWRKMMMHSVVIHCQAGQSPLNVAGLALGCC